MSLRNRVDPFGEIHAVPARGMFTGNRGVIHDPATRTLTGRRWMTKAWIICDCAYKGLRRDVMGANGRNGGAGWTELFFLDEVTGLAAGHRPCFTCRREAAKAFAGAFGRAFDVSKPTVRMMDARLHGERLASTREVPPSSSSGMTEMIGLPDGTMIQSEGTVYALRGGRASPWSFDGYGDSVPLSAFGGRKVSAITPATTIAVLREGFDPIWHPSAVGQTS